MKKLLYGSLIALSLASCANNRERLQFPDCYAIEDEGKRIACFSLMIRQQQVANERRAINAAVFIAMAESRR